MILELILAACIGQQKVPPIAPIDTVQVVKEDGSMAVYKNLSDQNKKVEELQKKVDELQARIDIFMREKSVKEKTTPAFKFVMSDRWGRKFGNDIYDKLVRDINYLNSQDGPTSLSDRKQKIDPQMECKDGTCVMPQTNLQQPQFYMPQQTQMGIGAAAASCAPGGS